MKQEAIGPFRKYVAEFIGTFFLVMAVGITMAQGIGGWAPLGIGVMLVALTYIFAQVSGSHFNPAVSIAVYLRGKLHSGDVLPYIIAQLLGSTLAMLLVGFFFSSAGLPDPAPKEMGIAPSIITELLGTLLLVYAYLDMFHTRRAAGNAYYGLVIGFAYMAAMYMFGPVSLAAFNPAVALGICMGDILSWSMLWVFVIASFAGGALAAFLAQYIYGPETT